MGTDLYDTLLGAAQVHVELDLPDQRTEFVEGLPRLVAQLEAQARQQNRQNWSDQAGIDSLQDYVPARKDRE